MGILITPKYNWYQTVSHVVVDVLIRNVIDQEQLLNIRFEDDKVYFRCKKDENEEYKLEITLENKILPASCSRKVYTSKVELKLAKADPVNWSSVEKSETKIETPAKTQSSKNWDQIASSLIGSETTEESVSGLLQQIYSSGSDEVKKAMEKSFYESSGTVLSTNWDEVKRKKVETKPPEGVEYRKWS